MTDPLPYATPEFPGIGGVLRQRPEDFFVQELPLYEASGVGEHILFEVQKVGLTTREAIRRIAEALGLDPRDVGYAGLKDRHAVTRQLLSVPGKNGVNEEKVMMMAAEDVFPQWAARHDNKLKLGHLSGNRFAVKIREVNPTDVTKLRPVLDQLVKVGLPNYYGEQRFGQEADRPTDALGLALVRGDGKAFLDLFLGGGDDREDVLAARELYDAGDLRGALDVWPRNLSTERRALEMLERTGNIDRAVLTVDKKMRQFYKSAAQSAAFNQVVADRVAASLLATVRDGDVAAKHNDDNLRTGGMFLVEDAAVEQPRCDRWEISPTGPMFGKKLKASGGETAEAERAAAAALGVTPEDFAGETGGRRTMRVRPTDTTLAAGSDDDGGHITVAFTLPAGSFATTLLREVMKSPEPPTSEHDEPQ